MIKKFILTLVLLSLTLFSACTTKYGTLVTSSEFVYPNSNVIPLGPTSASYKKTRVYVPKQADKETYQLLFNEALSKQQGANIIIDMGLDIKYTFIPLPYVTIWTTKIEITGTAARVEIGEQELTQIHEQSWNSAVQQYYDSIK